MDKNLENTFLTALEQNQQKIYRICSVYSKDTDETKDLFQESLIIIWQAMPSFKTESSIGTWMYRITLNVCLRFRSNTIKKQKKFPPINSITIGNIQAEIENTAQNEQLIKLRNCIKQLNGADKAVITLYLEELPYKEISVVLGLSENNVAVKVKRIKKKLLNCINPTL